MYAFLPYSSSKTMLHEDTWEETRHAHVVSFLSSLIERWEPSSEIQDFDENTEVFSDLIAE